MERILCMLDLRLCLGACNAFVFGRYPSKCAVKGNRIPDSLRSEQGR